MTPESLIPASWRFYSANFGNAKRAGSVTIIRAGDGLAWFNSLSDIQQELAELYLKGYGASLNEAIADAVAKIGGLLLAERGTP